MFKRLETAWNARTPVYLHPRTKENIIAQIALGLVLCGALYGYTEWKERQETKAFERNYPRAV